ncbi:MAG: hypothetical protein KC912_00635 [Proteobacteria bacterium]|nr:hypothetical protein [Pseudomonadota bacterium]
MSDDDVWRSESESSGCLSWFAGGLGAVVLAAFVVVAVSCCCCTLSWGSFVRFGIGEDLEDIRIGIRGSNLPDADKQSYVDRLEEVEDRMGAGELDMSFMEWVDASSGIEDALSDGVIESWELPIIEEGVRKMERH